MNQGQEQRIVVLHEVAQEQRTAAAAGLLGLSVRQVRRLVKRYRRVGAQAVEHGNRGRQPTHTVPPELRRRIVALAQTPYRACNQQHLRALLAEREGIVVSRSTVRCLLYAMRKVHALSPPIRYAAEVVNCGPVPHTSPGWS